MAAIPKTIIITPAILLIHQSCFNLNFFLNKSTKKVREVHHKVAPKKTPAIIKDDFIELSFDVTSPIPANAATKRKTASGFERVKKSTERKSSTSLFFFFRWRLICCIGFVLKIRVPKKINTPPPSN